MSAAEPARSNSNWQQSLSFYAAFDKSADADFARGDGRVYHSPDLSRKERHLGLPQGGEVSVTERGKFGGALQFHRKAEAVVFYAGAENVTYQPHNFGGTVSLWMQLNPEQDLAPGYVDPLQITDKDWNNSTLFLDFTKDDTPRHFRLGVFSDLAFWNPQNREWDAIPVAERPMIVSTQPPFGSDKWTHVAFTWQGFNAPPVSDPYATSRTGVRTDSLASFYLDGKSVGAMSAPQQFTWDPAKLVIMLGIYYTGRMDDFAIFDRPFSASEIQQLHQRSTPLGDLLPTAK